MEKLSILSIFNDAIIQNKSLFIISLIVCIIFIGIDRFLIPRIVYSILENITNLEFSKQYLIYIGILYFISSYLQIILDYKIISISDSLTSSLIKRMTNVVYDKYEEDLRGMEPQLLTTYFEKLNTSITEILTSCKWRKMTLINLPIIIFFYCFYLSPILGVISLISFCSILYFIYRFFIKSTEIDGLSHQTKKNKFLGLFSDYINNLIAIYNNNTNNDEITKLEKDNIKIQKDNLYFLNNLKIKKIGIIVISTVVLLSFNYLIIYKFSNISIVNKQNLTILIVALMVEMFHMTSAVIPTVENIYTFKTVAQKLETLPIHKATKKLDVVNNFDINIAGLSYETVLDKLDLMIPYGQRVAIMGKIGCGKSTAIKLIMKFIKPNGGSIYLGDINIDDINIKKYRSIISYIPQHINLFNRSIEDNLFYGSILSKQEKAAIIEKYNVRNFFGEDLTRNVGNNGAQLSGGQRQILYILRNIIQPSRKIFILDEPTIGLDANTKKYLINLLNIIQDKTIIIITHDDDILPIVNRIIMMDSGKIVEDETI